LWVAQLNGNLFNGNLWAKTHSRHQESPVRIALDGYFHLLRAENCGRNYHCRPPFVIGLEANELWTSPRTIESSRAIYRWEMDAFRDEVREADD
jgi:hypothetical protein